VTEYTLDSLDAVADMAPGFTVHEDGGHKIIKAIGEIDAYSAPHLTAMIREQIRDGHHRLIVDLTGVPFLDSSGLGALVGGYKRTRAHADGRFAVIGADKRFLDALRITGLVRVLPVYETVGQVLQARETRPHSMVRDAYFVRYGSIPAPRKHERPQLPCDRGTLLHLASLGDVDALVERSLLFGSA